MANRRISSEQLLEMLNDDGVISTFLMTDEAHLHLSGYVNKQNYRYWALENPQEHSFHLQALNHSGTKAKHKGRNRVDPGADDSSGDGKCWSKTEAVFEKRWETSE